MKNSSVIENYSDLLTDEIVYSHASDIDTVAYVLGIDYNYLSSQVRLHIPRYDIDEIKSSNGLIVIRQILAKLKNDLSEFDAC